MNNVTGVYDTIMKDARKDDPYSYRKELWVRVAVAVAGSSNVTRSSAMHEWADRALAEYDKRFKEDQ